MVDIIGSGWAFPVRLEQGRGIVLSRHEQDIDEAIRMILLTPRGQRVMRPEFGCQIHELIFAADNATTYGLAAYYIEQALKRWEPRITVEKVRAAPDPNEPGRLLIDIRYQVNSTYDRRTLVFPFYRIPEEAAAR
jgi:phage baseplate assembly protein W